MRPFEVGDRVRRPDGIEGHVNGVFQQETGAKRWVCWVGNDHVVRGVAPESKAIYADDLVLVKKFLPMRSKP